MKWIKDKNFTMKIVAVFFAVILWSYVMSEVNPWVTKEIPNVKVQIINQEALERANLQLMGPTEVGITVKISGRRNEIFNITEEDIVAQADIGGYQDGEYKVPITVNKPLKAEKIEDYTPKEVLFQFDSIVEKQLPVQLAIKGKPEAGFAAGRQSVDPEAILIKGPASWVNSATQVLATVDISNASENITTRVPYIVVNSSNKEVRGLEKEPKVIDVSVSIMKEKKVPIEPTIEGTPLDGYEVTNVNPIPAMVKIKGYPELIDDIRFIKTEPISVDYLAKDTQVESKLLLPEGIEMSEEVKTPLVKISVEEIQEKTFSFDFDEIQILNENSDLEMETNMKGESINITLRALESRMKFMTKKDLMPYIDLKDLKEGQHDVLFQAYEPLETSILSINPKMVSVTLTNEETEEVSQDLLENPGSIQDGVQNEGDMPIDEGASETQPTDEKDYTETTEE